MKQIITDIVSAVNFVRPCELNYRQFKMFLDKTESEYGDMYYCEVHWFSTVKVL